MRGQSGLRPRARQNGRLLHRILHRFREVVFGHLQVVFPRDSVGVAYSETDKIHMDK